VCWHPWVEHPGTGNDLNGMCGECAYEFEHKQRESSAPGCRLLAHQWTDAPVAACPDEWEPSPRGIDTF